MKHDQPSPRAKIAREIARSVRGSVREAVACGHSRSAKASLTELAIEVGGFKRLLADPERLTVALARAREAQSHPVTILRDAKLTVPVTQLSLAGGQVVTLNDQGGDQPAVIFLAGGAYFQPPLKVHWEFCDRLARASGARVVVACYPLAPTHQFVAADVFLAAVYAHVYSQTPVSRITIMGDSAGAGLAAGFCEQLTQTGGPQPGHLVLLSPWLDLDLTNPLVAEIAPHDVVLDPAGLRRVAAEWAGPTDHRDFRLSPLRGPVAGLRAVTIYVGTEEIMCPDAMAFTERLRAAGVPANCHLGRQLFHGYPLYPIPEGAQVVAELTRLINQPGRERSND